MTLSSLTPYTPIVSPSVATTGLWNYRLTTLQQNLDELNTSAGTFLLAPSGNTFSDGTYSRSGSTLSYLGALLPVVSVGTLQPTSGNTIYVTSHLSLANKRIEGVQTPSGNSDAATKFYVDGAAAGKITLSVDPVAYHTTSNSTVTLSLCTIAAGALAATGDMARIVAWGDLGTTVSGVIQITLAIGSTQIIGFSGSGGTVNWRADAIVMRTGATTIKSQGQALRSTTNVTHSNATITETLANALPVWLCSMNQSGLNTVSANFMGLTVEVVKQ